MLRALKSGARIAIVSPASAPKPEAVHAGIERLRALGYEPVLSPHALHRGPLYYAGSAEHRVRDLHAAFRDASIDAVLCTRGGWGSAELLPLLDMDLLREHAKPFLGYSDHTSLHIVLQQDADVPTFYAPMCAPDFARGESAEASVDLYSWRASLHETVPWSLDGKHGLHTMCEGQASGTLLGGCLAILAESLGTPYALALKEDTILFLEDVNTKPYQWNRMLLHLRYAGVLDKVKGIVFGDMEQCVESAEEMRLLEEALMHALRDFAGPIVIGLRSGHVNSANITLPLGVKTRLTASASTAKLDILEAAVS